LTRLRGDILLAAGRLDEAEGQLSKSKADARWLRFPLILWRILATQARLYLAQGRPDDADQAAAEAMGIVNDLAGQLDDHDLRTEFLANARAQIPGTPPYTPDRQSPSTYAGLTPREIEVLQAIADGLTDAEAGEQLFISTRTVSQHLRSIYNKLGVNNRAAAVRVAMEHELI
ncbi:MAG: response regulator transcription factor, partial [Chloroflexota bacterium]